MKELFHNYDLLMDDKKIELIDEVFTTKFIKESGGKNKLIEKIKQISPPQEKPVPKTSMSWKKGKREEIYFAKLIENSKNKKKEYETEFIVLKEDGKLKIDGTISDAN
jgi:hypothetical protein